jgi:pimeloyl-ACP methyl ester carboxylesterase
MPRPGLTGRADNQEADASTSRANELAQLQGQSVDPRHPGPHGGPLTAAAFALIHGGGGSAWDWHLVAPALRERGHDPVAVDLPSEDESAG